MDRTTRIAEEIKKVVSEMIQNELKDPRVKGLISVTKTILTKDLKFCKIYVSVMGADKEEVLEGIKSGAGYMRKELGNRIQIRALPELQFVIDDSLEYGAHIDIGKNKEYRISTTCAYVVNVERTFAPHLHLFWLGLHERYNRKNSYNTK